MPVWLLLSLAFAIGVLIYGIMVPKTPSAFDLPEAQLPARPSNPWTPVHSL